MAWCAVALVAALALPLGARAQDFAQGANQVALPPSWVSREKQSHVANCVVNIGIASTFLGKAGVAINAAVQNCDKEGDTTAACTAAVSGVVASFGVGAAFIAAAAAECRSSLQVVDQRAVLNEACAANTAIIVATLGIMVNAGAVIKDTCPGVRLADTVSPIEAEALDSSVRRLQTSSLSTEESRRLAAAASANKTLAYAKLAEAARKLKAHGFLPAPKGKGKGKGKGEGEKNGEQIPEQVLERTAAQNAACAFDVGQFTFLSARAGLMINYAVTDCSATALYEGGNINQAKCIVDVTRAIGAFGYTASGIAFAIFECPTIIDNLDAACAGAIINLVAGTSELVAAGADQSTTCHELGKSDEAVRNDLRNVADIERRLAAAAPANEYVV